MGRPYYYELETRVDEYRPRTKTYCIRLDERIEVLDCLIRDAKKLDKIRAFIASRKHTEYTKVGECLCNMCRVRAIIEDYQG